MHVDWSTYDEMNVDHFEIERSQNGQQIATAGTINANGNGNSGKTDYNWVDPSPLTGTSFYRIKEVDIDGESKYSSVVRIDFDQVVLNLICFRILLLTKKS